MYNKKRIALFAGFVLLMFLMTTFAGAPREKAKVAMRDVIFTDSYDGKNIAEYKVELGRSAIVPIEPKHMDYVFDGWYDYDNHEVRVENFERIIDNMHVIALYKLDLNNNGVPDEDESYFNVTFIDSLDKTVLKTEKVLSGASATAPLTVEHENYEFVGWDKDYTNVKSDLEVNALYDAVKEENEDENLVTYVVTFIDGENNKTISVVNVREGLSATTPNAPKHDGRVFNNWDGTYTNVKKDEKVVARYVDDKNNNGVKDNLDAHYVIEFVTDSNGSLRGKTKYENVLVGLTFEQAGITIPTPVANDNYAFDKWEPTIGTKVVGNVKYVAKFVPITDLNHNGIADQSENHFSVQFKKEGNGTLDGKNKYENVLVGLSFEEAEIIVPTPVADEYYKFIGWDHEFANTVTENLIYIAKFAPINDINHNGMADELEDLYTVEFKTEGYGSLEGTTKYEDILPGLTFEEAGVTVPEAVPDDYYKLVGWDKEFASVITSDLVYTVEFAPIVDKNNNGIADELDPHYTIEFVAGPNGSLRGRTKYENVLVGMQFKYVAVVVATPVPDENYVFERWDPVINKTVTGNATYTAIFVPANDQNSNGVDDDSEDHHTVQFETVGNGSLVGTTKYENVLDGLTFEQANIIVPEVEANTEHYNVVGWNEELNTKTVVESDKVYKYIFEPINDVFGPEGKSDGIADEDQKYTINIKYFYKDGSSAAPDYFEERDYLNRDYTVESPKIVHYTPSVEVVKGTIGKDKFLEKIEVVEYSRNIYNVVFTDGDTKEVIESVKVESGENAETPTPLTHENRVFVKWEGIYENVVKDENVVAIYADDINGNGIDDNEENHYTIEFTKIGNGSLVGTLKYENVLEGLTFAEAGIVIPKVEGKDYYSSLGWDEEISEDTIIESDKTYTYVFEPANDNFGLDGLGDGEADEEQEFTLIIKYQYENGDKALDDVVLKKNFSDRTYEIETPKITHYTADIDVVRGTIGEEDNKLTETVVVTYLRDKYTITFVDGDTNQLIRIITVLSGTGGELPKVPEHTNRLFVKWEGNYNEVVKNEIVTAVYVDDINNNGIDDNLDNHYSVLFDKSLHGEISGTLEYKNVLEGLTFEESGIVIPDVKADAYYKSLGWDKDISSKTIVNKDAVYTHKFGPVNDSYGIDGKSDLKADEEQEFTLTIKYQYENGNKAFDDVVLKKNYSDRTYKVESPVLEQYTPDYEVVSGTIGEDDYKLEKIVIVTYHKNVYKVEFKDYDGKLLKTENVVSGENAVKPIDPNRENYTFIGWDKEYTNILNNLTVNAQYKANQVGIRVEELPNVQFVFQKNSNSEINLEKLIVVYEVFTDGSEVVTTSYTNDLDTRDVVDDKILTISENGFVDTSCKYKVQNEDAEQSKFEVVLKQKNSFRKTIKSDCTVNCDSTQATSTAPLEKKVFEVIEHYDENVTITKVEAKYENTSEVLTNLYYESHKDGLFGPDIVDNYGEVRWSHVIDSNVYNPVYIYGIGSKNNLVRDVSSSTNLAKTVEITYTRKNYGTYKVIFENVNNIYKAIDEIKISEEF